MRFMMLLHPNIAEEQHEQAVGSDDAGAMAKGSRGSCATSGSPGISRKTRSSPR